MRLTIKSVLSAINELRQQRGGAPLKYLPKGYRYDASMCPIAISFGDMFPLVNVVEGKNDSLRIDIYISTYPLKKESIFLPKECPISQFVVKFDHGGFNKYDKVMADI